MESVHEALVAEAVEGAPPDQGAYYAALARVVVAARKYRFYAPMKDEQPEEYHAATEQFDAAWDSLDGAAAKVGKSLPDLPRPAR